MKNKILYILLATSLTAFLLVGCGTESADTTANETTQTEATEVAEKPSTEEQTKIETEQPTETVEPTEEPTPEQTEEPEDTAEPTEEPVPQYTYADMTATMYAKQSVNVRDLPSTDGNKIGGLSANQEVAVTGQCNETNWYRIDYNGSVGYVSNNYLVTEKPVVEVAPPTQQPTSQTANYSDCPYTLFEATFDGTYFHFYHDQTEAGYFAGCTSASDILTDLVWNTDFAKDYPEGSWFGLDHERAEATVIGNYKNVSPNVSRSDYMTVVYIKIPFKVDTP